MDQVEVLEVGDKVKHPKFGNGTIIHRSGDGPTQKVIVKFGAEVGEKKLSTQFANMKKIQDRPTLVAAPADGHAIPAAPAPKKLDEVEDDDDAEIADDIEIEDDEDEDADADAEAEDVEDEEEE